MRLELFDVRRRWPRQRTQRDDERGFVNSGILFSLSSSVQFVGLILPSNSHAEIKTRLYASAIFPISGDWDVLLPLIWNGLCDSRRAEITVMQFTGHSLPGHHWSGTFTLSHIISRAHLRDFFRLLAIGMCHICYLRNCRCDHHRAEITIMQFIGQSLPAHHFFYGTVRIFTLSHIVSQAVFYKWSQNCAVSVMGSQIVSWSDTLMHIWLIFNSEEFVCLLSIDNLTVWCRFGWLGFRAYQLL